MIATLPTNAEAEGLILAWDVKRRDICRHFDVELGVRMVGWRP
jgi:hypothetical protein